MRIELRLDYVIIILEVKTGIPFTSIFTIFIILCYSVTRLIFAIFRINEIYKFLIFQHFIKKLY